MLGWPQLYCGQFIASPRTVGTGSALTLNGVKGKGNGFRFQKPFQADRRQPTRNRMDRFGYRSLPSGDPPKFLASDGGPMRDPKGLTVN